MRHTLTTAVIASVLPAFAWAQTPPPADLTDEVPLAEEAILFLLTEAPEAEA